jgi:hypothetical protein
MTYTTMAAECVKKHTNSAFIVIPAILAAATVAMSFVITEDVFARVGYSTGSNTQTQANSNECDNSALCAITSPLIQGDKSTSAASNTQNPQFNARESTPGPAPAPTPANSAVELGLNIQCDPSIGPTLCPKVEDFGFSVTQVITDAVSPSRIIVSPPNNSTTFTFASPSTYQIEVRGVPTPTVPNFFTSITSSALCVATLHEVDITISGNVPPPGQSANCDVTIRFHSIADY